jgi:hypothetical protein
MLELSRVLTSQIKQLITQRHMLPCDLDVPVKFFFYLKLDISFVACREHEIICTNIIISLPLIVFYLLMFFFIILATQC